MATLSVPFKIIKKIFGKSQSGATSFVTTKTLLRSQNKINMVLWEYALPEENQHDREFQSI